MFRKEALKKQAKQSVLFKAAVEVNNMIYDLFLRIKKHVLIFY